MGDPKRKVTLYLKELEEIRAEARRLDRPIVWVLVRTWAIARSQIRALRSQDKP